MVQMCCFATCDHTVARFFRHCVMGITKILGNNKDFSKKDDENKYEKKFIPNSSLRPINSPYGHCAANPGNDSEFTAALEAGLQSLLK